MSHGARCFTACARPPLNCSACSLRPGSYPHGCKYNHNARPSSVVPAKVHWTVGCDLSSAVQHPCVLQCRSQQTISSGRSLPTALRCLGCGLLVFELLACLCAHGTSVPKDLLGAAECIADAVEAFSPKKRAFEGRFGQCAKPRPGRQTWIDGYIDTWIHAYMDGWMDRSRQINRELDMYLDR